MQELANNRKVDTNNAHVFLSSFIRKKQVIHPKTVWMMGSRLQQIGSINIFMVEAVSNALESGDFDFLDIML